MVLDKKQFLPDSGGQYEKDLPAKIIDSIAEDKPFMAMMAWETEVQAAAGRTYDRIHQLVAMRQSNGTSLKTNDMIDVLKEIAKAAWGKDNAKNNPGGAITAGLFPIFQDHLDSITYDQAYSSKWSEAIKGGWNRKLPNHVTGANFNSHCLVDLNCNDSQRRGIWLEFTESAFRKQKPWKELFGSTKAALIDEFINCEDTKTNRKTRDSVKLGLMEFTAACDRANNKAPLLRFGLCARIPIELETQICWTGIGGQRFQKHDAIHRIETISINGGNYILFIDYRYVIALPPSHDLLTRDLVKPVFRIRRQVLSDISQRYANHTTRLGIYSFQSNHKITKEPTLGAVN